MTCYTCEAGLFCEYCSGLGYEAWLDETLKPTKACRGHVEQLAKSNYIQHSRTHKRHEKRLAHRLMRRLARVFLDDAPRSLPRRGWSD